MRPPNIFKINTLERNLLMPHTQFYTTNSRSFHPFFAFLGQIAHGNLKRQIEYLKVENEILRGKSPRRIATTDSEKRRLIKFGLLLGGDLKKLISIAHYSTFRRWVNSPENPPESKRGRPKITPQEIQKLIVQIAKSNNWGYTRILGELKKLHIRKLAPNTVKNILKTHGIDPVPNRGEDSWDAYIKRTFQTLWACDFFTKTVWTSAGPRLYFILFFINIHSRKIHIAGITKNTNNEWVLKSAQGASHLFSNNEKKLLLHDRDTKFSKDFDNFFKELNTKIHKIPFQSPNMNPYAESWIATVKRECLGYFFVFGERHLRYLIKEYVEYYNTVRPHSSLDNNPLSKLQSNGDGKIKHDSRLGGILNHYYRE